MSNFYCFCCKGDIKDDYVVLQSFVVLDKSIFKVSVNSTVRVCSQCFQKGSSQEMSKVLFEKGRETK